MITSSIWQGFLRGDHHFFGFLELPMRLSPVADSLQTGFNLKSANGPIATKIHGLRPNLTVSGMTAGGGPSLIPKAENRFS